MGSQGWLVFYGDGGWGTWNLLGSILTPPTIWGGGKDLGALAVSYILSSLRAPAARSQQLPGGQDNRAAFYSSIRSGLLPQPARPSSPCPSILALEVQRTGTDSSELSCIPGPVCSATSQASWRRDPQTAENPGLSHGIPLCSTGELRRGPMRACPLWKCQCVPGRKPKGSQG